MIKQILTIIKWLLIPFVLIIFYIFFKTQIHDFISSMKANKHKKITDKEQHEQITDEVESDQSDTPKLDQYASSLYGFIYPYGYYMPFQDSDEESIIKLLNVVGSSNFPKLVERYAVVNAGLISNADLIYDLNRCLTAVDKEKINFTF